MKLKFIALSAFIMVFCFTANAQRGRKFVQPNEPKTQTEAKQSDQKDENRGEIGVATATNTVGEFIFKRLDD